MIRSAAFLLPILVCATLRAATPFVTPEQPLSTPGYTHAPYTQGEAGIASSGDQALAVWADQRTGMGFGSLFGARLAADGTLLDRNSLLIDADIGQEPAVAWNGREYVVVATERHTSPNTPRYLYSWRVGKDGAMVGNRNKILPMDFISIASNGSQVAVGGLADIGLLAVLGSDGTLAASYHFGDPNSIVVPAPDGPSWLAFYDESLCGYCDAKIQMEKAGTSAKTYLFDTMPLPMLAAATDGAGRYLLAWANVVEKDLNGRERVSYVHYAVVDRTGTVLSAPTKLEATTVVQGEGKAVLLNLEWIEPPAVVWDGKQFVVSWSSFNDNGVTEARVVRIGAGGTQLDPIPLSLERVQESRTQAWKAPQIAVTNSHTLFAWTSTRTGVSWTRSDVVQRAVRSLDELAVPREPSILAGSADSEEVVDLAAGDDGFIAAWREGDSHAPRILARVFPYVGAPSEVVTVSTSGRFADKPAVRWGGGVYLVAWREEEYTLGNFSIFVNSAVRILARRYDRTGRALDAQPIELARETYVGYEGTTFTHKALGIATDGNQFLVVWGGVTDYRLHAARVTTGGVLLDAAPLAISAGAYSRRGAPSPVWTGSEFFVVWYEDPTPTSSPTGLPVLPHVARATRVSVNGDVLDTTYPQLIATPAGFDVSRSGFFNATNGTEALVTWSVRQNPPKQTCSFAQRFDLTGKPLDTAPATIRCATGGGWFLWNGDPQGLWYRNAWWIVHGNLGAEGGIYATTASSATPILIAGTTGRPTMVKSIVTPAGIVVAYTRVDASSGNVRRIFLRRLSEGTPRGRAVRH